MYGGAGNDTYIVNDSLYWVVEEANEGIEDTVRVGNGFTLGANLVMVGGVSGTGNGLDNVITGNVLNNFIDGMAAADTMQGGAGDDQYYVHNPGDVVIEIDGQGYDSIVANGVGISVEGTSVERIYLGDNSSEDTNATGNALNNFIRGTKGNNFIDGGEGADEMYAWLGDDTFVVDNVGEQVWEFEGQGNDWVWSELNSYALAANVENLKLIATAAAGTGNALANWLQGNAGNNSLDGGGGNDTLWGGAGNDTVTGAD